MVVFLINRDYSMMTKLKKFDIIFHSVIGSFITLVKERGIRAEFQSAIGFFLLALWLIPPTEPDTIFRTILVDIFHKTLFTIWLFFISGFQTVSNIFYYPRLRVIASFVACLTWAGLAFAGIFTITISVAIPLFISFAIAQALVYIHLDIVEKD